MTACRVAWLDAAALNEVNSDGLSLTEQFMPVIMEELKQRQLTLNQALFTADAHRASAAAGGEDEHPGAAGCGGWPMS